jgi:hypothetical protein
VSPTAPTFVTLNGQLTRAHRRIRELETRETELLAHNRTLRAVIEELTNKDHPRAGRAARSQAFADNSASNSASGTDATG